VKRFSDCAAQASAGAGNDHGLVAVIEHGCSQVLE
jgi:hypothetical protein